MRSVVVVVALLVSGCALFRPAPTLLPFPAKPPVTFQMGAEGLENPVCLSEKDAGLLALFFDQLNAFKHAWGRLSR